MLHIVAVVVGRHVVGIHQGAVVPYKEGLGNFQLDKVEHSFFIFVFLEKDKKERRFRQYRQFANSICMQIQLNAYFKFVHTTLVESGYAIHHIPIPISFVLLVYLLFRVSLSTA